MCNSCELPYLMDFRGCLSQPISDGIGCTNPENVCPKQVLDDAGNPILIENATPEQIVMYMPQGIALGETEHPPK